MKLSEIIDIRQIEDDLREVIKDYSQLPQLLIGEQDNIPEGHLIYPRGVMKVKAPSDGEGIQATTKKVVDSSEEEFENDLEYTFHSFPRMTIVFDGYGNPKKEDINSYFQRIQNWFKVEMLGQRWFDSYTTYSIVIREVNAINDITQEFQKEYEQRLNLDIIVEVKQEVVLIEKTIEKVEVNSTYKK